MFNLKSNLKVIKNFVVCFLLLSFCFLFSSCTTKLDGEKKLKPSDHIRLGYLLNTAHAVPIVGLEAKKFPKVKGTYFLAGGYLINSIITGNIDMGYVGPGPLINALSKDIDLYVLAGSSYGGNSLVVSREFMVHALNKPSFSKEPEIKSENQAVINEEDSRKLEELQGSLTELKKAGKGKKVRKKKKLRQLIRELKKGEVKKQYESYKEFAKRNKSFINDIHNFAVPQYGNTQDLVAKRLLSPEKFPRANFEEITFIAINSPELETAFHTGSVDAALVPEPWGTILESKGSLVVSPPYHNPYEFFPYRFASSIKQINKYPAALLVVRKDFYESNKAMIQEFLEEQKQVLNYIVSNQDDAIAFMQEHFKKILKRDIQYDFLKKSFSKVRFSNEIRTRPIEKLMSTAEDARYMREKIKFGKYIKNAN